MFLKSIDLFGFKSFAERTHIEFTDGISALIGPNGCGKSNVVDAVKWVLGEQATKSLRAERMEDVIFNGTDSRKPVNVAEVTLTLHNDGVLPLEFPEITVKRRLFRSGDSEYFINGAPVKLKDLRELFYDTGIGKSAYSIMEQGKIDQILSTKPEDRRSLFEEAAGITRYKMRGREADRKLERTEANMHEVESVLTEVRRSYESLKKQADKTTRYRELRENQFTLEVELQLSRLGHLRTRQQEHESKVAGLEQQRSTVKSEIDALNERLESELDRVSSMEGRLVEVQKQLYGLEVEKSSRTDRIALLKDQGGQLDDQIEQERAHLSSLDRKAQEIESAGHAARAALEDARNQIAEIDGHISTVEDRISRAQQRQRQAREQIARNDEQVVANDAQTADNQRELRTVTDELVSALDAKLRESGYSSAERTRAEEELTAALEQLRITVQGRRDSVMDRITLGESAPSTQEVAGNAFEAIATGLDRVRAAAERYRGTIPGFLDDFLAPEGTITRKRSLDDAIEALAAHNQDLRRQNRDLSGEIEQLGHTVEKERANLEEMKLNRVQLQGRAASWEETAARHDQDHQENRRQHADLERRIERNQERRGGLESQIQKLHGEHGELEAQEKTLREELKELEASIAADNRSLKDEEQKLKRKMQDLAQLQSSLEEVQVRLAEKRTEIRGLFDSFADRHGRDLREFESQERSEDQDQKALKEKIAAVRGELKELGSVNLMAVEEFAEVSDRYEFLNSQLEDLRQARGDLVQVTSEIKRESEQLFVDTYNRIRKNFHTVFRRLFGGGRAELRLTDPDSILDSGIDILVQPPGKKLENIALLSGGERSLTAVALLFSTFMVRPSPFTLLDEIDAALDEHNVSRFVNMLHEFGEQSQFIVITHNKKTVAGARTLLGVTMQENGVSQVVAVRIDGHSGAEAEASTDSEPTLELEERE